MIEISGAVAKPVSFATFYRTIVAPAAQSDTTVTHLVFGGVDGFQSAVSIEDALAPDVLIAERLVGRPLDSDHGAPARLVSPSQYGYVNTKHLCRIELHTAEPKEERHPNLPAWALRHAYRLTIPPIAFLSARGSGETHRSRP